MHPTKPVMKNYVLLLFLLLTYLGCSSSKNSDAFISATTGRYLFNANEVLEVYFKEKVLLIKWRGKEDIQPLKVNDSSYYVRELNEKILFISWPIMHIELAKKTAHEGIQYSFKKMVIGEKTPTEYFQAAEFENAMNAFKKIQEKDSLDPSIEESVLNKFGYNYLNKNNFKNAIEIFKINTVLYPKSSNTYDSLADAYLKIKDTTNAIANYKKALSINPENRSSLKSLQQLSPK
jgi:tetratricopeptide (TPR) repeat protein